MVKITIYKNSDKGYVGFKTIGHAGFAKHGQDIVCAAISMLTINFINSVETFTKDAFQLDADEDKGILDFCFTEEKSPESLVLMNSLILGLKEVEKEYSNRYIQLTFKEV